MFNKFPEPIPFDERRQISQFYTKDCVVFRKNEVDECLKQHVDEWNTIRRKVRKLNTEDGWSLMYNAIIDYIEALPK